MQRRVKLPCMRYMLLLVPRSIMDWFVVVPTVTVSDCLFCGVWGFCVNVRIPLQHQQWGNLRLFSLVFPSVSLCGHVISTVLKGFPYRDRLVIIALPQRSGSFFDPCSVIVN